MDGDVSGLPSPGGSREVTVDGRVVLVSVIEGALTDDVIVKTLGPDTDIVEVTVGNAPGLWITGAPHELAYLSPDGTIAFERIAGNTLLWQNDQMIGRLEGFESIEEAIEFVDRVGNQRLIRGVGTDMTRSLSTLTVIALAIAAGCTANATDDAAPEPFLGAETLPPVEPAPVESGLESLASTDQTGVAMAVVDTDGQLGIVNNNGAVSNMWFKWSALVAPDATQAVLTLPPETVRTLTSTEVAWASLPDGEPIGNLTVEGVIAEATATSLDGEIVALTTLADDPTGEAIAGARDGTNIVIASRTGRRPL